MWKNCSMRYMREFRKGGIWTLNSFLHTNLTQRWFIFPYRALLEVSFCGGLPSHGIPRVTTWPFAEMPLGLASMPPHGSARGKLRCAPYFEHFLDNSSLHSRGTYVSSCPVSQCCRCHQSSRKITLSWVTETSE